MTREEAIIYGESKKARIQEKFCRDGSSYGDYAIYYSEMEFTSAALAALREQEERENLTPLTLEELRQIDAPVWCLCEPIERGIGFWCLCEKGKIITPYTRFYVEDKPDWAFLRRKPKEDSNG